MIKWALCLIYQVLFSLYFWVLKQIHVYINFEKQQTKREGESQDIIILIFFSPIPNYLLVNFLHKKQPFSIPCNLFHITEYDRNFPKIAKLLLNIWERTIERLTHSIHKSTDSEVNWTFYLDNTLKDTKQQINH